jgi:hypothetical protein
MSFPPVIFIDTSIYEEQQFNFSSKAITAFLAAVSSPKLTLLLPDPTAREIRQHINHRSGEASQALQKAEKVAPFLKESKEWSAKLSSKSFHYSLTSAANQQLQAFYGNFTLKELGYTGVDIETIMNWYTWGSPPFDRPNKKAEFPDAFAIAILLLYAEREQCSIAVISKDSDFKKACEGHPRLLYYRSLPDFTETVLSSDKRLSVFKACIDANLPPLLTAIEENVRYITVKSPFYEVDDVQCEDVDLQDLKVIGLGGHECTIAFQAKVDYSATTHFSEEREYLDPRGDIYSEWRDRVGIILDSAAISGTAKILFDDTCTKILDVSSIEFDNTTLITEHDPEDCVDVD